MSDDYTYLDDEQPRNPNLYIEATASVESGYILTESGATLSVESNLDILTYGE